MAEVLARFNEPVMDQEQRKYRAQACGAPMADGLWEGWIEFIPIDGGTAVRSPRETTQPNGRDAAYWASGLTPIYLEGSLGRALSPTVRRAAPPAEALFDGPKPESVVVSTPRPAYGDAVLDPFSVYEKGEMLLRKELGALSPWHLVNIIRAYRLSPEPVDVLNHMPGAALVDIIVDAVSSVAR